MTNLPPVFTGLTLNLYHLRVKGSSLTLSCLNNGLSNARLIAQRTVQLNSSTL